MPVYATMRIVVSSTLESEEDIKKFLEKVDADVSHLSSHDDMASTFSTLGQVLKLTKAIMDQFSQVRN